MSVDSRSPVVESPRPRLDKLEADPDCYCRTPFEWFVKTPVRQLVFFTLMQILIYYDRGLIAGTQHTPLLRAALGA